MRRETIAIHSGYDVEPTTKAVAVPIYQTAAYEFDSAEHAAALFNLETEGFRYSRISNPTVAVLEKRMATLEGGVEALAASTGQAALNYARNLNVLPFEAYLKLIVDAPKRKVRHAAAAKAPLSRERRKLLTLRLKQKTREDS